MALGFLAIFMFALIIIGFLLQIALYTKPNEISFVLNAVFTILISFLIFTSLPSNFYVEKILSLTWGILGILALFIKYRTEEKISPKLMLSIGIFGGLLQLFM